jgi:MYXO-CTERM domain-containing protein
MKDFLRFGALAALLLTLSTPRSARAQGTINAEVESIAGDDSSVSVMAKLAAGFNTTDCMGDVTLTLRFRNIPSARSRLVGFRGTNCNTVEARDRDGMGDCEMLDIAVSIDEQSELVVPDVPLGSLVDCELTNSLPYNLFFIATDAANADDDIGSDYDVIELKVDLEPPASPTNVTGGSGNSAIPVSWSITDSGSDIERFDIYVVAGSCGGDGGTATFPPKASPVAEPGGTARSAGVDGAAAGLELNEQAAVFVVAVDKAGNRSEPSAAGCITRVPTVGFCNLHEMEGGTCDDGCSVSAVGASGTAPWSATVLVTVLALAWRRRRRTR